MVDGTTFRYKKELDQYLNEVHGLYPSTVEYFNSYEVNTIIEPVGYALNNVKTTLVFILDRLEAPDYKIYLTGEDNFREEVAKTKVYKGNRDKDHKPAWYDEIREYLIDTWQAEVVDGIEADDAIADHQLNTFMVQDFGINAWEVPNCIVSTDKDLKQVPGWHYDWVKDELYYIEPMEASHYFWVQMISGDATDNIKGIPGMGEKKAEKYLAQFDPHEWEEAVYDLYENHYDAFGAPEVFREHYQLIKIGGTNNYEKSAEEVSRVEGESIPNSGVCTD